MVFAKLFKSGTSQRFRGIQNRPLYVNLSHISPSYFRKFSGLERRHERKKRTLIYTF